MPDITMCSNQECAKREFCYRAAARPSFRQSWGNFKHENCAYFWPFRVSPENIEVIELTPR